MDIAIIGSGALGLYYGALLEKHAPQTGARVHFLARSDYAHIKTHGLVIHSKDGDYALPDVRVYDAPEKIGAVDLVLIGLKTTASHAYEKIIAPVFHNKRTRILSLQNGIGNEDALAELFGAEGIVGGAAFLCSNRVAPGEIDHMDYGHIQISPYRASESSRRDCAQIAELFRSSGVDCAVIENYYEMRWRKQTWNVPFNGLCTLHDLSTDQILAVPELVQRVRRLMGETIELGRRISATLAPELKYDVDSVTFIENQLAKTATMGAYQPSMLVDARHGRELEIAGIFGACLEQRDRHAPVTEIPEIEALHRELLERVG